LLRVSDLAASALRFPVEQLEEELTPLVKEKVVDPELFGSHILFAHRLAAVVVNCASAAYTASIQHFERKGAIMIGFNSTIKLTKFSRERAGS